MLALMRQCRKRTAQQLSLCTHVHPAMAALWCPPGRMDGCLLVSSVLQEPPGGLRSPPMLALCSPSGCGKSMHGDYVKGKKINRQHQALSIFHYQKSAIHLQFELRPNVPSIPVRSNTEFSFESSSGSGLMLELGAKALLLVGSDKSCMPCTL